MRSNVTSLVALPLVCLIAACASDTSHKDEALASQIVNPSRNAQFVARDAYRHPEAELEFFGIKPTMTVVEIWPGTGYWTEILAPYLKDKGSYIAAVPPPRPDTPPSAIEALINANKPRFGAVKVTQFSRDQTDIAPPGSADMVLTFRNLHDWAAFGWGDVAFTTFYKALKPGGILGIEDHRARSDRPEDPKTGYLRQDLTIALAEKAGFRFIGSSEIDANPKDTKDWPAGVWTLPPTLRLGDTDREKYLAVGEADNFVLKFQKPRN